MFALSYVYTSDEYADTRPIAMIELNADTAKLILSRRKILLDLKEQDDQLRSIQFWNGLATWLGPDTEKLVDLGVFTQEIADKVLDSDVVLIENMPSQPHESLFVETEADTMILTEEGVYWRAFPKHEDVTIETRLLPYSDLEPILVSSSEVGDEHERA